MNEWCPDDDLHECGQPQNSSPGHAWTCPDCGRTWVARRAGDMAGAAIFIEKGLLLPDTLGWEKV